MPRSGSDVYSEPAGTKGAPNTTIESTDYNAFVDDLVADANNPRPISAGGTGAATADAALRALGGGSAGITQFKSETDLYVQEAIDAANAVAAQEVNTLYENLFYADAKRLLSNRNGIAFDYIANDADKVGGTSPTSGTAIALSTLARNDVGYGTDANGNIVQYAANTEVFPSRIPESGEERGIFVTKPVQGLIYHSQDLSHSSWALENNLTAAIDVAVADPTGGSNTWKVTDTDAAAFGGFSQTLTNAASNDEWFTAIFFAKAGTSSRLQLKPVLSGGTTSLTLNITFDLETGTILQAVNGTGEMIPYKDGWYLCIGHFQNNATGNTTLTYRVFPDIAEVSTTNYAYVWECNIFSGRRFTGYRAPNDKPLKPTLTLSQWQDMASGTATAIGEFDGTTTNQIVTDMSDPAWVQSNVSDSTLAGAGVNSNDAYRITDTSAAAFGFTYEQATGLTNSDWVYMGAFIDTSTFTGQIIRMTPQLQGGTTIATQFIFDVKAKELVTINNDTTSTADYDIVPVDDDIVLFLCWLQNDTSGNTVARSYIYVDYDDVADTGYADISQPFIVYSASEDKWTKQAVETLPGDVLSTSLSGTAFNVLSGTLAVDASKVPAFETTDSVVLAEISDGSTNYIRLTLITSDESEFYLAATFYDGTTTGAITSTTAVELAAARWWVAWNEDEVAIGRDETTLNTLFDLDERPTGLTTLYKGSSGILTNAQPCTSIQNVFYVPERIRSDEVYLAGTFAFTGTNALDFTDAEVISQTTETVAARDTLSARTRTGIYRVDTSTKQYILINGTVSQSFLRAAVTAGPPYLDHIWHAALGSVTWDTAQMLGGSVRGAQTSGTSFVAVTDMDGTTSGSTAGTLNDAVGTIDAAGSVYDDTQVQAGYATYGNVSGESPIVGLGYEFTRLNNDRQSLAADNTTNIAIVGVTASATDSTLAAVAGEDDPSDSDLWQVGEDYVDQIVAITGASNLGWAFNAVFKGEAEYANNVSKDDFIDGKAANGVTSVGVGMDAALDNLAAMANTKLGQTVNPLTLSCVPSMKWIKDSISVGQAWDQLETDRDDVVVAVASYQAQPGTDANEHPSPYLGSTTLGLHMARAAYNISCLGENYFIPKPYKAWQRGKVLHIGFLAMDYPMLLKEWFTAFDPTLGWVLNRGFRITLGSEEFTLASEPEITGGIISGDVAATLAIVRIELNSTPTDFVDITYAGATGSGGHGNLFDSGAEFSEWEYRFLAWDLSDRDIDDFDNTNLSGNRACRPFRITAEAFTAS